MQPKYSHINSFVIIVQKIKKKLPKDAKYVVRGLNILRDTTLKSYNDPFMTEDEYDEYTAGKVKDNTKFKYFYGFTISIRIPNEEGNLFL